MPCTVQHRDCSHMANVVLASQCCFHSFVLSILLSFLCSLQGQAVLFPCSFFSARCLQWCLEQDSPCLPSFLCCPKSPGPPLLPPSLTDRLVSQSAPNLLTLLSYPAPPPHPSPAAPPPLESFLAAIVFCCMGLQAMQPGLTVTSVPLNIDVPPSPRGTLAPAVSYKLIKLDQSESKDGSDPTPKFVLAGQDANDPLLPTSQSKHVKNRKVCHMCCVLLHCNEAPALALFVLCEQLAIIWAASQSL